MLTLNVLCFEHVNCLRVWSRIPQSAAKMFVRRLCLTVWIQAKVVAESATLMTDTSRNYAIGEISVKYWIRFRGEQATEQQTDSKSLERDCAREATACSAIKQVSWLVRDFKFNSERKRGRKEGGKLGSRPQQQQQQQLDIHRVSLKKLWNPHSRVSWLGMPHGLLLNLSCMPNYNTWIHL